MVTEWASSCNLPHPTVSRQVYIPHITAISTNGASQAAQTAEPPDQQQSDVYGGSEGLISTVDF